MKKLMKKIEDLMAASALAEMGESEAVRDMAEKYGSPGTLEKMFAAAAFAEAGEFGTAREIAGEKKTRIDELSSAHPDDCQYGDNDMCFLQA